MVSLQLQGTHELKRWDTRQNNKLLQRQLPQAVKIHSTYTSSSHNQLVLSSEPNMLCHLLLKDYLTMHEKLHNILDVRAILSYMSQIPINDSAHNH